MANLTLRPATLDDAEVTWEWANDPVTRQASFDSSDIPWPDHRRWFEGSLSSSTRQLWLAQRDDLGPCGLLRLDALEDAPGAAVVSINVAPHARGQGVGKQSLRALSRAAHQAGFSQLIAWIRPDNGASVRAFQAVGYVAAGEGLQRGQPALRFTLAPAEGSHER